MHEKTQWKQENPVQIVGLDSKSIFIKNEKNKSKKRNAKRERESFVENLIFYCKKNLIKYSKRKKIIKLKHEIYFAQR